MYKINILNTTTFNWEQTTFNGKPMTYSSKSTLLKAIKDNLGNKQQILCNEHIIAILDGTEHQLGWFIDNQKNLEYQMNRSFGSSAPLEKKVKIKTNTKIRS